MKSLATTILDELYVSASNKVGQHFPQGTDQQTGFVVMSELVDVVRVEGGLRLKLVTPIPADNAPNQVGRCSRHEYTLTMEKG